jgi:hypothetical protein
MDDKKISWNDILQEAVTKPGSIRAAHTAFYNYSLGNQILALMQCSMKGISAGPIATYPAWQAKGRQVMKGQKAIALWMR